MNIYKERGRFIENVKKKKNHFVPMGFFSCLCVIILCLHKKKNYINNPLCTVSKSLVLNAAVSSKSSNLKKCICTQSDM